MIGRSLGHFRIDDKLGEGGMGELYRATDERLGRSVAIKVLRPEAVGSASRRERFAQEARAASALNHPNIITVYDVGEVDGVDFIAMELVSGSSLETLIPSGGMPIDAALAAGRQVADALAAAHAAGIVHRDIKPQNIMVDESARVKVLDFGLAKLLEPDSSDSEAPTRSKKLETREGAVLGTAAYMSPEQAEGRPVDAGSDIFSFGAVLYEMLAGRRAFHGDSFLATRAAVLRQSPTPLRRIRPDVPTRVAEIVARCLEKDRERRCRIDEVRRVLEPVAKRPRWLAPATVAVAALLGALGFLLFQQQREHRIRTEVFPEIDRLIELEDGEGAFRLAQQAQAVLGDDPELQKLLDQVSVPIEIRTDPPGADLKIKAYEHPDRDWIELGTSPVKTRVPTGIPRWRIEKAGYETLELAYLAGGLGAEHRQKLLAGLIEFPLTKEGDEPRKMVAVPGGRISLYGNTIQLAPFWIDRFETTNREFKEFVDAGGYESPVYWEHAFVRDGERIEHAEALRVFVDRTGRPGPSTWELGGYPDGEDGFPVRGISWYEAAAYSVFREKALPTIYHWAWASGSAVYQSEKLMASGNFEGNGPQAVGTRLSLGPFGTYDMAGNVNEWCLNAAEEDERYLAGGAWSDAAYLYWSKQLTSPWRRDDTLGVRLALYDAEPSEVAAPVLSKVARDFSKEQPADDVAFAGYRTLYDYDEAELDARIESVDDTSSLYRDEKVSFPAAYGGERMTAHLLLPRNAEPPYQTIVYYPGDEAFALEWGHFAILTHLIPHVRSGRAAMYPAYVGMFDRKTTWPDGPVAYRDRVIQWTKDLMRSVDYLATRDDIDMDRLAFIGRSRGANHGAVFTAVERRFKASILSGGSLSARIRPEIDSFHFAPRVEVPTLLGNGRFDFNNPVETTVQPLLDHLGVPPEDKKLALFDSGHVPPRLELLKEELAWLDRYLGPVKVKR